MKSNWNNAKPGDTIGKERVEHTPGPWIARPVWLDKRLTEGQASIRANVTSGAECPAIANGYSAEETNANARLIAAAPDLLEACKMALEFVIAVHGSTNDGDIQEQIRQAIAKAEGAL